MTFTIEVLIIGLLLIVMVLSGALMKGLSLSNAMFYLAAGFALGPTGWPRWRCWDSAVQVELLVDRDRLRISRTGKGGVPTFRWAR
jgi:Kef-type K+ transport system membrane component KefB